MFSKYRILKQIGRGMSGTVYLAEHIKLKSLRVVKCVDKSHILYEQFLSEATLLKNLKHPSIPVIFDLEEDEEQLYIIEEYIEGTSLQAIVLHQTNISLDTIIDYGIQICEVFEYLHHYDPIPILYLDLKPSHIIVCNRKIKIIDFGTAILMENDCAVQYSLGTPAFAAPEQISGVQVNQRTDIYAIGTILYFMLTGKVPNIQKEHSTISKPLEVYPRAYRHIIQTCLEEHHLDRYEDVTVLKNELLTLVHKNPTLRIAVIGSQERIGATHVAIALTSYFNQQGIKCLYEEKRETTILKSLKRYDNRIRSENGLFCGPCFFGIPSYGVAIEFDKGGFSVLVQDYGVQNRENSLAVEADYIMGVLGCKPWEMDASIQVVDTLKNQKWIPLLNESNKHKAKLLISVLSQKEVYGLPAFSDPFRLPAEVRHLFDRIFLKKGEFKKIKRRVHYIRRRQDVACSIKNWRFWKKGVNETNNQYNRRSGK